MTERKADSFTSDYVPPTAIPIWRGTDGHLYAAYPSKSGPPMILRYDYTEGDLAKALTLLTKCRDEAVRHGRPTAPKEGPDNKHLKKTPSKPAVKADEPTREMVRDMLKKGGLI